MVGGSPTPVGVPSQPLPGLFEEEAIIGEKKKKKRRRRKKEEGKLGLFSLRNFSDFGEEGNSWFVEKQS